MRPHIGLDITPAIRLMRPLGAGGMGSVWVGHHSGLRAEVAVKFLSADLATSEGAQHRFADEASAAAQIKSPHVVQVHDHGVFAGELPFIVMELLDGEHLARRVWRLGPLDLASTMVLVLQLGHVLSKAHAAGIVHRDVKPENVILLHGYGEMFLKLIDFGVAKRLSGGRELTASGMVVGTPDFMCPEQLMSSKDVGPAVDAWALAAVAYYALVGVPPFARETVPGTFLAIEKGDFALPFQGRGIGSQAIDAFFVRALCPDPEGRFASLADMVAAFCDAVEVQETRTLRSEVASSGERSGTLQVSAGSGAWLSAPQVTTRDERPQGLPPSPMKTELVAVGLPEAPPSAVVAREPAAPADTPAPEDSRHPPAVTTVEWPELEAQAQAGRARRHLTWALALGLVSVIALSAHTLRPPEARSFSEARVPPVGPPVGPVRHDERAQPRRASDGPKPSPAAPALFAGDTLPTLEEAPAAAPPSSADPVTVAGVGGDPTRGGVSSDPEVQSQPGESSPPPTWTPRKPPARSPVGRQARPKSKDRGF